MSLDQLKAYAALGKGEIRGYYIDRKRKINLKAQRRRANTKSRLVIMKIKADKAKEMAELEESTYLAMVAAQKAKAKAKAARHAAGEYTTAERLTMAGRGVATIGGAFFRGLTAPPPKARRRKTTKRQRK